MHADTTFTPVVALTRLPFQTRYLAIRPGDEALVVVKRFEVLAPEGGAPPSPGRSDLMRRALVEEIRIQSRAAHRNVVPILAARTEGAAPFAVFPLIPMTLRDALWTPAPDGRTRAPARFARDVAGRLLDQLLIALEFLHAAGIVHRQLAPGALRLAADGRLLVDGFGMARDPDWDAFPPGTGGGPPGFAAPEQLADASAAGPRGDLFSVGRLAYRMLTGRLPESGRMLAAADIDPAMGRPLSDWMGWLMADDPGGRPVDAAAARAELSGALG